MSDINPSKARVYKDTVLTGWCLSTSIGECVMKNRCAGMASLFVNVIEERSTIFVLRIINHLLERM